MNSRLKNVYFYLGLVGVVFAAAGIDFNALTSWGLLMDGFMSILRNPVALMAVAFAIIGVFIDPTTPGLKDENSEDEVLEDKVA